MICSMIILGIDPGSRLTGFGLIKKSGNRNHHMENGTLYLEKSGKYTDRLVFLYQEIQSIINAFKPEAFAIENIFYYKNPKSIQKLGEVRGVAMLSAAIAGLPIFEYTPLEVKKAVDIDDGGGVGGVMNFSGEKANHLVSDQLSVFSDQLFLSTDH